MNFGETIEALKHGKKVTRKGWNGKGMYLWLLPAATVKAEWCKDEVLKEIAENNGGEVECLGAIRMKTADNKILTGWVPSQTDMLAEDWEICDGNDEDGWNCEGVRYFRANVGGVYETFDLKDGKELPCVEDNDFGGNRWNILIDIKDGKIINWKKGIEVDVYAKVCDDGVYTAYDNNMQPVWEREGYVPKLMDFDESDYGYGDYFGFVVEEDGHILDWPNKKLKYLIKDFIKECKEGDC